MEIADNEKDIQDFSRMLKKAYSSQIRKHFPDIGFFRLLAWQNPEKELAKVFLVKYKGKIIGGSICLFSKESAYCGSQEVCGKPMLFFTPVFCPYGHLLPMLTKKDMHIWNSWMQDYRSKSTVTGTFILRFGGKQSSTRRWFRFSLEVAEQTLVQILYLTHFCLFCLKCCEASCK